MKFKKFIKKGVGFFLALFLFVLTPFSAFGYGTVDSSIGCVVTVYSTDKIVYAQNLTFTENGYFIFDTSSYKQPDLNKISLNFEYKYDIKKGDIMMIDFVMSRGRYRGFSFNVDAYGETNVGNRGKTFFKNSGTVNGDTEFTDGDLTYDYSFSSQANSSNTFHFENAAPFSYNGNVNIDITLEDFDYTFSDSTLPTINLGVEVRDISASVESPESGQGKKLLSGLSAIIDYIKEIFQSIGELPSKIGSFITNLGSQISGFFTKLTTDLRGWFDNIGKWFTDLGNNIKQWFTNLTNNLKTWFDNIGQWFTELGNDISSWFNKLFNKLWWGNENGESEYQPPVFSSGLTDVIKKVDEYCDSLDDTLGQIDNSADVASGYIKQGTGVINDVLGVMPSAVIVLITFGIVFIFSRKVVGR